MYIFKSIIVVRKKIISCNKPLKLSIIAGLGYTRLLYPNYGIQIFGTLMGNTPNTDTQLVTIVHGNYHYN